MTDLKLKSYLFALATCLIGGGALAQAEQSKSELLEDLLSGSDVCVNLGYVSEDGVKTERLEYEKKLMSVNQQLAQALAELENVKSEDGKSSSSSVDERLDFLRDAAMQCEKKFAALSEQKNSGVENGKSDPEMKQQVAELERQLSQLQSILALYEQKDAEDDIQIQNLGNRLNAALARVASEEREKRQLEQNLRLEIEDKLNEITILNTQLVASKVEAEELERKVQFEENKRIELAVELNKLRAERASINNDDNLGKSITAYKKTVQRLLNEKKCNAGKVDGLIGAQTIKAAESFVQASNFRKKTNLVYDEEFFNHLKSSSRKCTLLDGFQKIDPANRNINGLSNYSNSSLCAFATRNGRWEVKKTFKTFVKEAKRRGLTCGVSR